MLLRRPMFLAGSFIVLLFVVTALVAPSVIQYNPVRMNLAERLQGPSSTHKLGTDEFGRDILMRLVWGSRVALIVTVTAVPLAATLGTVIGLGAGYYGRLVDTVLMRVVDVLLSFPTILLAIMVAALLGSGITTAIFAISFAFLPRFARLVRGSVLAVRELDFVEASRSFGASDVHMILRHILPNTLTPIVVMATLSTAQALLLEASLSFLGLGVQPPTPTWGNQIASGRGLLTIAPWISIPAGLAIMTVVMGLNLLGDGLRDALDPRLRVEP